MGYVIINNKEYKIIEIEGDEFYYKDENGMIHAIATHSIDKLNEVIYGRPENI